MNTLFVCHSIGDTNALLATAKNLVKKTDEEIIFLIVGQAAKSIFEKTPTQDMLKEFSSIKVNYLSDILSKDIIPISENGELDKSQRENLNKFLQEKNISKALIGTPSQLNALVPFQIAEDIANYLNPDHAFIFNDYFFKDNNHIYWNVLEKNAIESDYSNNQDWRYKFTWLAPLPAAEQKIAESIYKIPTKIVGHPSIDAILEQTPPSPEEIASNRQSLQVSNQQALLFISGTKEISADAELLQALLNVLEKQKHDQIEVRMGIHPGISDAHLNIYISTLLKQLESFPHAATHIKLIINDSLVKRIDSNLLKSAYFIKTNVNGDAASAAADGVASAVPSTLVNQAAIQGKAAYYHQDDKEPYLPKNRLFVGEKNFPRFFEEVKAKRRKHAATKKELGVPNHDAAEIMASMLVSKI